MSLQVLDAVYAGGCRHIDTAHIYADSEALLGKWFKKTGKRDDEIFLATKFGITTQGPCGDPEFVKEQFTTSLERLGVETIDLYYQHKCIRAYFPSRSVKHSMMFCREGKVKYLGSSECTAEDLRRAHAVHPISALQVEFSPFVLDIESEEIGLLKTARELGVTIVAYSPLARGLLTGQYKSHDDFEEGDFRRTVPKYRTSPRVPKILEVVKQIEAIGRKHNATAGQVTLTWILAQGDDFVVIPGTKKIKVRIS
ncbi:NADP-dependent oxidoreductase domain-containing protein [Lentinula aff. lateritia]|uniref:NADP-dependent oxidoreductase domain-containing protein n=1 Tax=Lentinula aff. lateritia TaxID=2804960 RepID=A0ACC1U8B0_9AGAR|nr:NADP-dependent oxidoreductase domain-containing protein [Lentinula aff. lateritia]